MSLFSGWRLRLGRQSGKCAYETNTSGSKRIANFSGEVARVARAFRFIQPPFHWRSAIVRPRDEYFVKSGGYENISVWEIGNEGCKCANSSHCEALGRRHWEIFTQLAGTSTCTAADVSS